jgi:hypothetical protein
LASDVDICNLALANLGDTATVASIDPPESSAQAEHCARFYPMARNALLEMANWNFAMRRATLAELTNTSTEWQFAYAMPSNVIKVIAVHLAEATDDYSQVLALSESLQFPQDSMPVDMASIYTPQPFTIEVNDDGDDIILTNAEDAVARYTAIVTDPTKFSPLFVIALSWLMSSMLAGPLMKGETGAAESKRCLGMLQVFLAKAAESDASQRKITPRQVVPWISGR